MNKRYTKQLRKRTVSVAPVNMDHDLTPRVSMVTPNDCPVAVYRTIALCNGCLCPLDVVSGVVFVSFPFIDVIAGFLD